MLSSTQRLTALKYIFGPLLLIQGIWVRKNTLKLIEPVQQKSGASGNGSTLRLLLLGDSSAAGVGADVAEETLLGQLIQRLSPQYHVNFKMYAESGKTTAAMLLDLEQVGYESFDVVITALGVNDVTAQVPIAQWQLQQLQLIQLIKDKFTPRKIIMSGLPPVGDFPALPWPLNAYMGQYADVLNETLLVMLKSMDGVVFHSLRGYPTEAQSATDGFHPGPKVYELWAENLNNEISKYLSE